MKKVTILIINIVLIFNLIVSTEVFAYPNVIDNSIEKENLQQMENAIDPNLANSIGEEGTTTLHKGRKDGDDKYKITDEKKSTKGSDNANSAEGGIIAGIINLFPTTISAVMSFVILSQQGKETEQFPKISEYTIQDLVYNRFRNPLGRLMKCVRSGNFLKLF